MFMINHNMYLVLLKLKFQKQFDVPLITRNILEDSKLKIIVKAFSHWPTFPQIFIKAEFDGTSNTILNIH